ncbi:MAG TPA: PqqD family protein [Novosphingobium sp.]|nr:PqqD family protein [Novosphingobium sp.]
MIALAKATGHFSETVIDAEVVVMSLDSGDFFSLTGTARDIWELIDGTHDRAAIVAALAGRNGVVREAIVGEIDAFLAQLAEAGLLATD